MTFEDLYNKYYAKVLNYVSQHISNQMDAEDLTENVFIAAYKAFDSYDPEKAQPSTWIFCITKNRLKNYYRDRKDPSESIDEMFDTIELAVDDEIGHAAELEELRGAIAKALQEMNERERDIVVMSYFRNMNANEIAEELDLTAVNVRKILSRTLKKLRPYLEEYY